MAEKGEGREGERGIVKTGTRGGGRGGSSEKKLMPESPVKQSKTNIE